MIFDPRETPRIFGVASGADFPAALVAGLTERTKNHPPENLAQTELIVNTRRMQRRIMALFEQGPARLVPKIRLVTDFSKRYETGLLEPPTSPLRRRFELINLIKALLDREPDLAPKSALYDLANSLSLLLDEMHDEKVTVADIVALDVSDRSGHWERSQMFLEIIGRFTEIDNNSAPDTTARQRKVIDSLIEKWRHKPPDHPIILAGSTGSRGSTASLLEAVAQLPQGAIVLPGFDFDLPANVWKNLADPKVSESHPQFRLGKVCQGLGVKHSDVKLWHDAATAPVPARNRLISLALRPAPVTDQWMREGPELKDLDIATKGITLIEAPSERTEAMAIALILREAAEKNQMAALVTPDQVLSRRVRAALDRWRIEPDISAGDPLETTAPGRLFRHIAEMLGKPVSAENLLIVLKHPFVNASETNRRQHLVWVRELELFLRRHGAPFPSVLEFEAWAESRQLGDAFSDWVQWILQAIDCRSTVAAQPMADHLKSHLATACNFASGPSGEGNDHIWGGPAGGEMKRVMAELTNEAGIIGDLTPREYENLFLGVLRGNDARDPVRPHPKIMIWGTLEARVQGADLVILGGLNEGTWPHTPSPDPWLNREMRLGAGLLLPERQIGLSAHDFQQAIAAEQVVLCRSVRNDEAPSVASRWLSRITNLMEGISNESNDTLKQMRIRGQIWLDRLDRLESPDPIPPEPRPAPAPPVDTRPNSLSVTAITRLIRDPYAIYARHVLSLAPLDPLQCQPDARFRGIILHKILEEFIDVEGAPFQKDQAKNRLLDTASRVLANHVPWPATRLLWQSRMEKLAETFISDEQHRRSRGNPVLVEELLSHWFTDLDFRLTAKVDRIDQTPDGHFIIYDYKSGKIPTVQEMEKFEKQLYLEALLLGAGAFKKIGRANIEEVAHIGLGSDADFKRHMLKPGVVERIRAEFFKLVSHFKRAEQGYSSRRAVANLRFSGDYDHLARFGEWDDSQSAKVIEVGQ